MEQARRKQTGHRVIQALVEGAVMVALAEVLGYLKLWHMPQGGSVSLMMLPVVVYALRWGLGHGLLAGLAFGILDFLVGGGIALGWQSILGDYVAALTALGLAGVGHRRGMTGVILGSLLGCLGRTVCVFVTGAVLWGVYMPDEFLGMTMTNEWFYSFLYNIPAYLSLAATVIVCIILAATPARRLLLGEDLS